MLILYGYEQKAYGGIILDAIQLLRDAYLLATTQSQDPMTKIGAILVNQENVVIGQGTNCLPDGIKAEAVRLERPGKYDYMIHAEQNAIAQAARKGHATKNATLYCPWAACTPCARLIIQSGIAKVITHKALMAQTHMKWLEEIKKAHQMFYEADIEYIELDTEIGGIEHIFNGTRWNP